MNKGGILNLEEALEVGISGAKKTGKAAANAVSDTAQTASSQITGRSKDTQDIVESLYGKSEKGKDKSQRVEVQGSNDQPKNTPEDLEKKKKLQELRQQLHNEVYYDPLVNPPKPKEEERPAEKVEREEMKEIQDFQKKEKEKPPLLVTRNQQRGEKFPGQSG